MKKTELVYREILYRFMGEKNAKMTQLGLANALKISLSTVNNALNHLSKMGAVKVNRRNFEMVNPKKILYYWASIRNLNKDIIYKTCVEYKGTAAEIEKRMPSSIVFGAYTAYKFKFKDAPADYSEVYVYCADEDLKELIRRFPAKSGNPNLFALSKDFEDRKMPVAQIFVDLWNIKEWYANDFINALEKKLFE